MPDPQTETLQRTRRIETRLTQLLIHHGIDTQSQKPTFVYPVTGVSEASIILPSLHTSLKEIRSAVPSEWTGPIRLVIGTEQIGMLQLDRI